MAMASVLGCRDGAGHAGAARRCYVCWPDGAMPPYEHDKCDSIPRTKHELLEALRKEGASASNFAKLTVPELGGALKSWRTNGGTTARHPSNPLTRATSIRKAELIERCRKHGLLVDPSMTVAKLLQSLRQHWEDQCQLAAGQDEPLDQCDADTWSLIHGDDDVVNTKQGSSKPTLSEPKEKEVEKKFSEALPFLEAIRSIAVMALSLPRATQ